MGMYTALYGTVTFKPYIEQVLGLIDGPTEEDFGWHRLTTHRGLKNHPDIKNFLAAPRYHLIGTGERSSFGSSYDEDRWLSIKEQCGNDPAIYDAKKKLLTFHCSLKDYDKEINRFLKILPAIATEWDLKEMYEELKWEREPDNHVSSVIKGRLYNLTIKGDLIDTGHGFGYGF